MKLKTPPYLKKGDLVALVTPAGFIENDSSLILAEKLLKSWGLKAIRGKFVLEQDASFAGTDTQRLEDLQKALDNPKVKAIWAVRGGYGSMRILSQLNFNKFLKNPKWIIGFSDITALHNMLHNKGYKSIHGIMPINLKNDNKLIEKAVDSLYNALFGKDLEYIFPSSLKNRYGSAEAVVVGGNLSLLQSLLGTSSQIKTKNKILFIEEIGEELYRIDRLLHSLKLAGIFKDILGLIVGGFTDIKPDKHWKNQNYQDLVLHVVKEYDFPVIFNMPAGHIDENRALILGGEVVINVGEFVCCIRFQQ
ncbi:MAG TPA: LD-carboxypeptidase [Lutibacter sp.]|nr:LD-carboxypeptidase [Lutibacter sp.]